MLSLCSPILLSMTRAIPYLLACFLVLTACGGGGGSEDDGSGSGDPGNGDPGNGDPGNGDPGSGDPGSGDPGSGDPGSGNPGSGGNDGQGGLNVRLTFAPISGGFRIGNQSDFGNFVSLKVTATSGSRSPVERNINIGEFADSSYDFTGLADLDWKFQMTGILGDNEEQRVNVVFVWNENEVAHNSNGIRSGLDTDGDRRADSVDEDDDNDNILDLMEPETVDGRVCRLHGDCDNDGLGDNNSIEQQTNSKNMRCSLLADCDGDTIEDMDEVAVDCVLKVDCDGDSVMDGVDIDDDGDGLIEVATPMQLDAVRYALNGEGRKLSVDGTLDTDGCGGTGGIRSCSGYELVADISLAAYAKADGGKGWQPLGEDERGTSPGCQGVAFNGTFEGNGWTISDLNLSRSAEDCVGLFGHLAEGTTIRNLTIQADEIMGKNLVGGLAGEADAAQIVSVSVVAAEVSGTANEVGGLVGWGRGARIVSASVVANEVSGKQEVGGLVGDGESARIVSAEVVVREVSGNKEVGGLVGHGQNVTIIYSSVVAAEVGEKTGVGGLTGSGNDARILYSSVVVVKVKGTTNVGGLVGAVTSTSPVLIISSSVVAGELEASGNFVGGLVGVARLARVVSSSVVANEVSGASFVGGLAGDVRTGQIAYSYVVSGSDIHMLIGATRNPDVVASYWDSDTGGRDNGNGDPKTGEALRMPTGYDGIYADWDDDTAIFSDGSDEPLGVWCDKDNSGTIEAGEKTIDNHVWDFGTSSQYPAIRCTPLTPADWRSWWFLDGTPAKPQLNQTRLDQALDMLPSLD